LWLADAAQSGVVTVMDRSSLETRIVLTTRRSWVLVAIFASLTAGFVGAAHDVEPTILEHHKEWADVPDEQ
jgi:hypothetical protein